MKPGSPRTFEIPFVLEHIVPGNILNIGGAGGEWKWGLLKSHSMTIVDVAPLVRLEHNRDKKVKMVREDIRNIKIGDIGRFSNIILMSTLEHISLPGFHPRNKPTWKTTARAEQLRTFRRCMSFLKPDGRMLFTVPCGIPTKSPIYKLHYNENMLANIKGDREVLVEEYYKRVNDEWVQCSRFPSGIYDHAEEKHMQTHRGVFAKSIALMVLRNKQ